jgi:predicted dehydrogenase
VSSERHAVVVGCGPRAREHVAAYRHVHGARVVAACARTAEHVNAFCESLGIEHPYTDVATMIDRERPDLVHLVTTADERVPLMEFVVDRKVPVAIIEKPIAIQGEDFRRVRELVARGPTQFVVNTQLPFHPMLRELESRVAAGEIGEVRLIEASAGSTILDQGVHLIDLAHRFAGFAAPARVFAQVAGGENLKPPEPSPDDALISVTFETGVHAHILTGTMAPRISEGPFYLHKRIAVIGSRGSVGWSMTGWERQTEDGGSEGGPLDYSKQDIHAQAALTEAALGLLDTAVPRHPTDIELALVQFDLVLGAYLSALSRSIVHLPCDPPGNLLDALRTALLPAP